MFVQILDYSVLLQWLDGIAMIINIFNYYGPNMKSFDVNGFMKNIAR